MSADAAGEALEAGVSDAPAADAAESVPAPGAGRGGSAMARLAGGLWRYLVGSILCWFAPGSVLVVGWVQRRTRRAILRSWWSASPLRAAGVGFEDFLRGADATVEHLAPPRWVLGVPWCDAGMRRGFGGLGRNLREGLAASVNVMLYTLPGGLLWAFGWFSGWQVSFHKGYEHFMAGRLIFIAGMVLFILAMLHVPLAAARQAASGDPRRFHDLRVVRRLARRRWMAVALLGAAYFGLGLGVMVLRAAPFGLGNTDWVASLDPRRQLWLVQGYFLAGCFLVFPAYLFLRTFGGWIYAGGVRDAVQRGEMGEADLSPFEWEALVRLGLASPVPVRRRGWLLKILSWTGTGVGRVVSGVLVWVLWFLLIWQVMVAEFFNHHAYGRGWWNQPLVQLPWFDYTPVRLYRAAREAGGGSRVGDAPAPAPTVPVPGAPAGAAAGR